MFHITSISPDGFGVQADTLEGVRLLCVNAEDIGGDDGYDEDEIVQVSYACDHSSLPSNAVWVVM